MGTNNDDYPCVCSRATTASATITLPVNTTFVELWGTSGPTNAPYTVTVTPSPPHDYGSEFRRDSFNPWESHPTLLYFNALDPDLQYTVVLTNLGRDQDLCIHSARVYLSTATNDGPPPAPNDDPSVFPMPGDGSIPSPLPSGTRE
jgi:hypothetical protein